MEKEVKTFVKEIQEFDLDPHVMNLWYRYIQHLEIGCSHWRDSVIDEMKAEGRTMGEILDRMMNSKNSNVERELLKKHPGVDANQLRLQMKYGSRGM